MFLKPQHLHFAGIGGIGMSGIAEVLINLNFKISGSDLKLSPITDRLQSLGATIYEGHSARNLGSARALVISSAVREDNPELVEARRRQIPVIPRGELLAELMRLKYGIAIAGSHGKTSTTSMVAAILSHAGLDPTVVVGGRVRAMGGSNARVGQSEFLVVESDESDGSFLKLAPILAVVTNIDHEHLDHYKTFDKVLDAFAEFINRVPFYGAALLCLDDPYVQRILPSVRRRTVTYGESAQADLRVSNMRPASISSEFQLTLRNQDLGCFRLNVPGIHNVLNATAAVGVALELEVPVETIRAGVQTYSGVDRRMQVRGEAAGAVVLDDYGHHPTEIRATLAAVKLGGHRRMHVLFQPHRYTRTQMLMDDFAQSFHAADHVYIMDIYAAAEPPIEGVTADALTNRLRQFGHRGVEYVGSMDAGINAIVAAVEPGDVVLTLGAGSVSQAGERILRRLADKS
ncbi:MAG: UDP-N-acetylmuramate--L-alanine ligase [Bryobacterales bacterium]|nr:UDP-N-acetylmuramate--L-alanine ligase [Bryobacterales bacterium]